MVYKNSDHPADLSSFVALEAVVKVSNGNAKYYVNFIDYQYEMNLTQMVLAHRQNLDIRCILTSIDILSTYGLPRMGMLTVLSAGDNTTVLLLQNAS